MHGASIERVHERHLFGFFLLVSLIDAQRINPEEAARRRLLRVASWHASLAIAEGDEGGMEIGADVDSRAVASDRCLGICAAPVVREGDEERCVVVEGEGC